jgi:glycosyltransferase involved in cell wall biosynthesis
MKFSIIVPTFNRVYYLDKLIDSIKNQTYSNWELIIIDDHSTDETWENYKLFNSNGIKFFRRKNNIKGACSCRNEGLFIASGDLILFLDSDDFLLPTCLENRLNYFQNGNFDFIVTNGLLIDEYSTKKYFWNVQSDKNDIDRFLSLDSPWQTTGPTFKRKWLLENHIFWDLNLMIWQDVDFHIQVLDKTNNYKVFWNELPDYVILINEKNSISRVDYYNPIKQKSQFYFLQKHSVNMTWRIKLLLIITYFNFLRTKKYSFSFRIIKIFLRINIFQSFMLTLNLVCNILSINRFSLFNKYFLDLLPLSTIGQIESNEF